MTDIRQRINDAIEQDSYFNNNEITRLGWNEGYLVQLDGTWYLSDFDCDTEVKLPAFIKSKEDAELFLIEASSWYKDGFVDGKNAAKKELRAWFQPE